MIFLLLKSEYWLISLTAINFLTFSEANKKLHDTNDDLRAALEVKYFIMNQCKGPE